MSTVDTRREAIPFFPPALHGEDRRLILDLVYSVGTSGDQRFILGERVGQLEAALVEYSGARHVVACASGTGALTLAIDSVGVEAGDEVVVPAFACQPLASTVVNRGATPVFADIDPLNLVVTPETVGPCLSERTKAIVPAHTFSMTADMPALRALADTRGIALVEDAAVAQGATISGRAAGLWGDVGVYSFFQVKALGGIGEGGVVLTDDEDIARTCRMLRNHGQDGVTRFLHHRLGYNSRMDEIMAAFLLQRLPFLPERLSRRADIADFYSGRFAALADQGLLSPPCGREGRCYYVYAVQTDDRDGLRQHLAERGVGTHVYYPLALPEQPAFAAFRRDEFPYPNAVAAGKRNLALPIWPDLSDEQVEYVVDAVRSFYGR